MKKGYRDLKVYNKAFELAVMIQQISCNFPPVEKYSLTDQIRRSSRSVCACIAEAYRKRRYRKYFISKVSDAHAECSETTVWLEFAQAFKYLSDDIFTDMMASYDEVGRMLHHMENNPDSYS